MNKLVAPEIALMGYELIELDFTGGILRLTIDKPGGVTLDDCVAVNRRVSLLLDSQDPIKGSYRLEVSSPGLTRRLKTYKEFDHFTGRRVKIQTKEGIVRGTIKGLAGDNELFIDSDGSEILLHMQDIIKANLEFDF
ncbi:MAG TPA: ribosome maturation factor RimP [Deltaproteobacteria bacterium]|nr:ribosome maturation factor RimP [Deltaproteobacteria bacterium]HPJ93895.1 ribosome maturation factor RimP [Deltaproteobacteria bacterium]HPR50647.1 ribosome maturation factor RimP [Deltaproteobacteria bacterium]